MPLRHLGHIPMAKVGAIQSVKFRMEGRSLGIEGERIQRIIALASEVEPLGKNVTNFLGATDPARRPFVE